MEDKTIQLRCQKCGGTMTIEENNSILFCTWCGSRELIRESDNVAIERIKNNAYKDIELSKLQYEERKEQRFEEKESIRQFKNGKLGRAVLSFFVICLLVCIFSFSRGKILAGMVALLQTILFALAWLMGMQIIKEKRHYLHVVIAVLAFVLIIPFFKARTFQLKRQHKFEWPQTGISAMLPKPETNKGDIYRNSNEAFYAGLDGVSEMQYQNYLKGCQEKGFTVEAKTDSYSFEAYNADGYKLRLTYFDSSDDFGIYLDAPIDMKVFRWPDSELASLIPVPKSNIGHIEQECSSGFIIYVGNTTKEDYIEYIEACRERGFTVDYSSGEDFYNASNAGGCKLKVEYEGNNIISISMKEGEKTPQVIDEPDKNQNGTESMGDMDDSGRPQRNDFDVNTAQNVLSGNYIIPVPAYWQDDTPQSETGFRGYVDFDDRMTALTIGSAVDTEDPATFEVLYEDKDNMIKAYERMEEFGLKCEFVRTDIIETKELKGMSFDFNFTVDENGKTGKCTHVVFPSEKDNKWIYVSLYVSDDADFSYSADFMKMIKAIKKNDGTISEGNTSSSALKGIRPEFKKTMDSYEAFFEKYIDIIKRYQANPSDLSLMMDYFEYLEKYSDAIEKLDALGDEDMSTEETVYYTKTMLRIKQKLLNVVS